MTQSRELLDHLDRAMRCFDETVKTIRHDQWHEPTACTDWDVRALVNHVTVEQLWAPRLLDGATLAEVGNRFEGDMLGPVPVAAWKLASRRSQAAFVASGSPTGRVYVSYGVTDVDSYGREMMSDLVIHSWDLARAIGGNDRLDPELVAAAWEYLSPKAAEIAKSGLVGARVSVPNDAGLQQRLLGLMGRHA